MNLASYCGAQSNRGAAPQGSSRDHEGSGQGRTQAAAPSGAGVRVRRGLARPAARSVWFAALGLLLAVGGLTPLQADGCFVFRWDKKIDIQEPNQKAIIVHEAGREDMLLQVKFAGRVEDFGWLIPVPSLPTVERGTMQPFYELSRLTQRWEAGTKPTMGLVSKSAYNESEGASVKVIETKTVGAYDIAILSAREGSSLTQWLQTHDYSIPNGRTDIIDDYLRQGWYFIAVKIHLGQRGDNRPVDGAAALRTSPRNPTRRVVQRQLSSGELHPLLISFDTPKCVYPLRISAIGGKPSEVSLYVLSTEPLLNQFVFDKRRVKVHQRALEWERKAKDRNSSALRAWQNSRSLALAYQMYSNQPPGPSSRPARDWSIEDLEAIRNEEAGSVADAMIEAPFDAPSVELLACYPVSAKHIPQCAEAMPRLKAREWYLTKQVWAFAPSEMRDLVFQRAAPALGKLLSAPEGRVAAEIMRSFGAGAAPVLLAACQSPSARERVNASSVIGGITNSHLAQMLITLLNDEVPEVRLHAIQAIQFNWAPMFAEPLVGRFGDPHPIVRSRSSWWLGSHETHDRVPVYLTLLHDTDPNVQACALKVLAKLAPAAVPRVDLERLLSYPESDVVWVALNLLRQCPPEPTSQSPAKAASPNRPAQTGPRYELPSREVAPLARHRLATLRLEALRILQANADAAAVELALPMLRDANSVVRRRAFAFFRYISGQDLSQDNPAKWEQWWATNQTTFAGKKAVR